jgi:hypothetical protein
VNKESSLTGVEVLILDRSGAVLVETDDGYAFEPRTAELLGAVVFDGEAAEDAIDRVKNLLSDHGPFQKMTVSEYKTAVINSFGTAMATPKPAESIDDSPSP